jgi:hypothetical protein
MNTTVRQITPGQLQSITTLPGNGTSAPPRTSAPPPLDATPEPRPADRQPHHARRTGRIARLPKLHRDMVNRMLTNGIPYKNIVQALAQEGFTVTERKTSNWATGGHLKWRLQQDLLLQHRLDQDQLLDRLRSDDATDLPEVGLQAAATRLSQILLDKAARAEDIEASLPAFAQMVNLLCRLTRQIAVLQKNRDDSHRALGKAHDPARLKALEREAAIKAERYYSDPPADAGLEKPAEPPELPPVPAAAALARTDARQEMMVQTQRVAHWADLLEAFNRAEAQVDAEEAAEPEPPASGSPGTGPRPSLVALPSPSPLPAPVAAGNL